MKLRKFYLTVHGASWSDVCSTDKLEDIFDISYVYLAPVEVDILTGDLSVPKYTYLEEIPPTKECEICAGTGEVTIQDWIDGYNYEADVECKSCDGYGKIELEGEELIPIERVHDIILTLDDMTVSSPYLVGSAVLFKLQGKPCSLRKDHILFYEKDVKLAVEKCKAENIPFYREARR